MYLSVLVLAAALVVEARNIKPRNIKVISPTPFKTASSLATTFNVLTLKSKKADSSYNPRSAAFLLGHATIPIGNSSGLISLFEGEEFATDVTFGTQTFEFIVDTGSSDTWVIESGFDCVDVQTSEPEPEDYCAFGPTYTVDDTFVQIPGENFNITYGDGEFLTGILGWQNVTLAGLTVNQTVPLVNFAAWYGDGETSGLLGLAYPGM
jgi:Eukaryotic aspartyl protease